METNPEFLDPPWFMELVRRAFDREVQRLINGRKLTPDEINDVCIEAMWYVFDLRKNLTDLYQAGAPKQPGD